MDARLLKEYRDRWRAVKEVEIEGQRRASITVRWQQLHALIALARGPGLSYQSRADEIETVRQHWVRLKVRP
jgi:hypothetical protein